MSKQQFHFYCVGMPVQVPELLKCIYIYRVSVTLWLKIAPLLDYGALLQKGPREGVRYFLEVSNKQTQTEDSGGMCWTTTKYRHQLNMVMFWIHLLQTEKGRTIKKGFSECKSHPNWVW